MAASPPLVFIIGGTGAQGMPIVKGLVQDGAYRVRILTRDPTSRRAQELQAIRPSHVAFALGTFFSEADLRAGFRGADYAFVNIDGFNAGEQAELYWTVRAYELALEEGVRFYVHGNLDYGYKLGGYDPALRTGHYDGKGRAGEWILQQTRDNGQRMGAALFTTGPYVDMVVSKFTPVTPRIEDGIVTWRVPLDKGSVAFVDLDDCGHYVRWLFDNQARANGTNLAVAIDLVGFDELAAAFAAVSGKPAKFVPVSFDDYWTTGPLASSADRASGYSVKDDDPARTSMRNNFTGFWNVWRATSTDNQGVVRRDFKLLNEIHPQRTRSVEQWFRKQADKGSLWERVNSQGVILKIHEDRGKPPTVGSQL